MPCFLMFTNVSKADLPANFLEETSKMITEAIRKPETYVTVRIHPDQMMCHGGTMDRCANSELQSIGNLGEEDNKRISHTISNFLKEKLDIDPTRNYIKFTDMKRSEVGYKGTTFAGL